MPPAALSDLEIIFQNVLRAAVPFAGIVSFVFLVMGGFKYITSNGDAQKAAGAKNTVTYAVIGLVLVGIAFLIINIIAAFTGQMRILNFQIRV